MGYDAEEVAQAFLAAYSAVYGDRDIDQCDAFERCVFDPSCPIYPTCIMSDDAE